MDFLNLSVRAEYAPQRNAAVSAEMPEQTRNGGLHGRALGLQLRAHVGVQVDACLLAREIESRIHHVTGWRTHDDGGIGIRPGRESFGGYQAG